MCVWFEVSLFYFGFSSSLSDKKNRVKEGFKILEYLMNIEGSFINMNICIWSCTFCGVSFIQTED